MVSKLVGHHKECSSCSWSRLRPDQNLNLLRGPCQGARLGSGFPHMNLPPVASPRGPSQAQSSLAHEMEGGPLLQPPAQLGGSNPIVPMKCLLASTAAFKNGVGGIPRALRPTWQQLLGVSGRSQPTNRPNWPNMLVDSPWTPIAIPNHPEQVAWKLSATLPEVGNDICKMEQRHCHICSS